MARKNRVSEAIYRHHIRLFRFLNDAWIFTTLMRPLLKEKGDALIGSKSKAKKEYPVPKKDRTVSSRRRDEDVGALFLAQHGRGIYDTNIISIISRVEAFIQDCMFEAVKQYPEKLAIIGGKSGIPLDLYLKHEDRDDLLEVFIALRCQDLMFGKPSEYLAKAAEVLSIQLKPDVIATYVEMKASRDLIIHNGGRINQLYLDKAGRKARGEIDDELDIDEDYFEEVIVNAKALSGTIQRETEKKYG
ncbi:hypothetical protein SAMN05216525_101182 [Bradyrhizobium sp. Gha]|nr:hypothetical protein SAMN05216525_101182 [Bradyrhizobium sp. Gha]